VKSTPVKPLAQCATCGRHTSVRRDGTLHAHNHPGWRVRCPGTQPAGTARKGRKVPAPGEVDLWGN